MVSIFSSNILLEEPAHGDQTGVWDTPLDSNWTILDRILGGVTTLGLNNSNVALLSSQYQSKTIVFNSTLTGSVTITFPTSFVKSYEILNQCSGSSAFTITLATTAAGGQVICAPPSELIDVRNGGANLTYTGLRHRVGKFWDYAGSSLPSWISGCTVPPYLNCDGTTFSSATYPQLATVIGSTTLPDSRGRGRWALNQGSSRVTTAISGLNGDTRFAGGGGELMQQHNHTITDPGHTHGHNAQLNAATGQDALTRNELLSNGGATINSAFTGITANNAMTGNTQNMPPVYIGGMTLIRAV